MTPKELRDQFEKETGIELKFVDNWHPYGKWLESRLATPAEGKEERAIEMVDWIAKNFVPVIASRELKYWQKGNYQNNEYFYSTKEVISLFQQQQSK